MQSNQYWCYINNNEEFEYIKNLPRVKYRNVRIKDCPKFPIVFNLDLRAAFWAPFWVFNFNAEVFQFQGECPELSFEEMKPQIFIHQLTM